MVNSTVFLYIKVYTHIYNHAIKVMKNREYCYAHTSLCDTTLPVL